MPYQVPRTGYGANKEVTPQGKNEGHCVLQRQTGDENRKASPPPLGARGKGGGLSNREKTEPD